MSRLRIDPNLDTVYTDPDARFQVEGPLVQQSVTQQSDGSVVFSNKVLGPGGTVREGKSSLDVERFKELVPSGMVRGNLLIMPARASGAEAQPWKHNPGPTKRTLVIAGLVVLFVVFVLPRL